MLDFWFAKNTNAAAPLIVFIHGGGFVGGNKSKASPAALREALDGGAAFMSINYRFREHAPIQDILRDAARAIQFVRADAARFHIDPKRIASFGSSAGAGTSLWLAAHDDLADPKSADPVLRQSSRISAAGSLNGQATYDLREWDRVIFPFKPEWLKGEDEGPRFYHFKSDADYDTEQGKRIRADCNMLGLLTADDPPIYLSCSQPDGEPTNRGHLLHHPRHAQVIERRCKELGIPVTAVYAGDQNRPAKTEGGVVEFLLRHVGLPVDGKLTIEEAKAYKSAHPELRPNRQADKDGKPAEEAGEENVSEAVLKLYEAREFKGAQYRLLKPIDLETNPTKKYPMVLSLHGAGGTGTDNVRNLRYWNTVMAEEVLRRKHPCFVVVPQTQLPWQTKESVAYFTNENISKMSKEWKAVAGSRLERMQRNPSGAKLDSVFLLLDELAKEFPIDTDRVYVVGHSMGGFGTWTAVAMQPDRFAAAITAAGWPGPWLDAKAFKDTPIWSFQGAQDKPEQVILGNSTFEWMKAIGAKMKFTEVANIGHGVMVPAFSYTGDSKENTGVTKYASDRCDKTPDVWEWLFGQKRAAK